MVLEPVGLGVGLRLGLGVTGGEATGGLDCGGEGGLAGGGEDWASGGVVVPLLPVGPVLENTVVYPLLWGVGLRLFPALISASSSELSPVGDIMLKDFVLPDEEEGRLLSVELGVVLPLF